MHQTLPQFGSAYVPVINYEPNLDGGTALPERSQTDVAEVVDLYERNLEEIYAYVIGCLPERALAEQVVHEVFVQEVDELRAGAPAGRQAAVALYRAASRAIARKLRSSAVVHAGRAGECAQQAGSSGWSAQGVLALLPLVQRQTIVLRHGRMMSTAEIAQVLDLPMNEVDEVLRAAQSAIRRQAALLREPDARAPCAAPPAAARCHDATAP